MDGGREGEDVVVFFVVVEGLEGDDFVGLAEVVVGFGAGFEEEGFEEGEEGGGGGVGQGVGEVQGFEFEGDGEVVSGGGLGVGVLVEVGLGGLAVVSVSGSVFEAPIAAFILPFTPFAFTLYFIFPPPSPSCPPLPLPLPPFLLANHPIPNRFQQPNQPRPKRTLQIRRLDQTLPRRLRFFDRFLHHLQCHRLSVLYRPTQRRLLFVQVEVVGRGFG